MDMFELIKNFGLPIALCVFFVWRGDVRETRMAKSIEDAQKFIRDALIERDEERATAMSNLSSARTKQAAAVVSLVIELRATRVDRNGGSEGRVRT